MAKHFKIGSVVEKINFSIGFYPQGLCIIGVLALGPHSPILIFLPTASALNAGGPKRGNHPKQEYPRWRKRFRAGLKPFRA